MEIKDWEDKLYREIYESILSKLEFRKKRDPNFSLKRIKGELETMYINQDNSWAGRSAAEEIKISATISAFEFFIAKEEKEES